MDTSDLADELVACNLNAIFTMNIIITSLVNLTTNKNRAYRILNLLLVKFTKIYTKTYIFMNYSCNHTQYIFKILSNRTNHIGCTYIVIFPSPGFFVK